MALRIKQHLPCFLAVAMAASCDDTFKNDYRNNSPTSGKLRVYCDEGLFTHVTNQAFTFESQYPRAHIEAVKSTDDEAIQALWKDSCEAIVISRQLSVKEKKLFATRKYDPKYSAVAHSGIALVVHAENPLSAISLPGLSSLLKGGPVAGKSDEQPMRVLIDKDNSSVMRYLTDSLTKGEMFGRNCSSASSTEEVIRYVCDDRNTIGIIDFARLSDRDDPYFKGLSGKIRFLGIMNDTVVTYPGQSAFKTREYPLTRTVYVMRKTGEFSLAKGFESFVAGPKGQLTFLKQGLMPARQEERRIEVNLSGPAGQE